MDMIVRAMQDAANFVGDRAQDVAKGTKNVGYTFVCVTGKMSREVGGTRSLVGFASASIGLIGLWVTVSEPFKKLSAECATANGGLGALHMFQGFGEFAAGTANKSAIHCAGKVMVTFKNIITFAQFLEGLAMISAGTCQGTLDKITGYAGFVVPLKNVANAFEFVGYSFDITHNLTDLKRASDQDGIHAALTWKRGFAISLDVAKLAAVGLTFAGPGIWIESARFVALLGVSSVHIGRALHEHITGQKA